MNLKEIWPWIKNKFLWAIENWVTILVVFLALMILIWFIVKLWRDTISSE